METVLTLSVIALLIYIVVLRIIEKRTTVIKQLSETEENAKQPIRDYTNAVPLCILVAMITAGIITFVINTPELLTSVIVIIDIFLLFVCGFLVVYPLVKNKRIIQKRINDNSIRKYDAVLVNYKYHRVANKRYTFYPVYSFTYKEKTMYILGDKPDRKSKLSKTAEIYICEKENLLFIKTPK